MMIISKSNQSLSGKIHIRSHTSFFMHLRLFQEVLNYLLFNLNKIFLSHKLQANEIFIHSFSAYPHRINCTMLHKKLSLGFYFIGFQLNSAFKLIFTFNLNYFNILLNRCGFFHLLFTITRNVIKINKKCYVSGSEII